MIITRKELDELAYLLHANVQRGDYERQNHPTQVEESKFVKHFSFFSISFSFRYARSMVSYE